MTILTRNNFKYTLSDTEGSPNLVTINIDKPLPSITSENELFSSGDYGRLYKSIRFIPGVASVRFVMVYKIIIHKGDVFDFADITNKALDLIDLHFGTSTNVSENTAIPIPGSATYNVNEIAVLNYLRSRGYEVGVKVRINEGDYKDAIVLRVRANGILDVQHNEEVYEVNVDSCEPLTMESINSKLN